MRWRLLTIIFLGLIFAFLIDWYYVQSWENREARLKFEVLKKKTNLIKKNSQAQKIVLVKTNVPLKSLAYVGHLKDHLTTWALLQTPSGQIVYAQKGDYLGKEGVLIQSISEAAIILKTRKGQRFMKLKTAEG